MHSLKILCVLTVLFSALTAGTVINEENMFVEQVYKDYELAPEDTIQPKTHVKVFVGNARVSGVVQGLLTVYAGDIYVDSLAVIQGAVRSLGGEVHYPKNYSGNGKIVSSNLKGRSVRDFFWKPQENILENIELKHEKRVYSIFMPIDPLPVYEPFVTVNTQQGFYLMYGDIIHSMGNLERTTLLYKLGYGFSSKEAEGAVQLRINFFEKNPLHLYGLAYHEAQSQDWRNLPELDNGLAYLLLKQDYHTRYLAEGYRFGGVLRLFNHLRLKGEYVYQNEDTLAVHHHNTISMNSVISRVDPGRNTGYRFSATLALGNDGMSLPGALQLDLLYETYASSMGGGWDFDRLYLSSQYIGTIGRAIQYRNRIAVASLRDDQEGNQTHPKHYEYTLGGIGTLRGISYKSFQGQRMFLMNHELGVGFDDDLWFFGFIDVGMTDDILSGGSLKDQLTDFDRDQWVSTIGLGIETGSTREFGVRFDIAKDMSTSKAPWISYFRLSRTF
ncbi:hypothetical protein [Fidelibacter multiformis]|jgi:hypothetical protein|uniref:hypothetical protein n=1 Tax=Fidelibacter multiformis TaxID=3377529 RepID=UPI0037DD7696